MKVFIRVVAFLLIIFLGLYFYKPSLFQPKIYDLDTINVNKYITTPNPARIVLLNLKLASTTSYSKDSLAGAIQLYFDSIYIFKINILDLLENSENKKLTLNTYIKQIQNTQTKLENTISNLENNVIDENSQYEEYQNQKIQGDQEFGEGFVQKDSNLSIQGFSTSVKNGPIATKHRIIKNANLIVVSKLKRIKQLIDLKLQVLENNNEDIVSNFEIIKGDLLRKLQKLKYQLETNDYTQ